MTRSRLRGKTARASQWADASKALVEAALADVGMRLVAERENAGEWNDRRVWFFEREYGTRLDPFVVSFKGERTDWSALMRQAAKVAGDPWEG